MNSSFDIKIDELYYFNHGLVEGHKNPASNDDGCVVLVDISISMRERSNELKMVLSALSCLGGLVGKLKLPDLEGTTSLADAANTVSANLKPTQKFMIITDGDDTSSVNWKFDTPAPEPPQFDSDEEYYAADIAHMEAKQAALLHHLETTTHAEIFLIGIGNEVRDFIKAASRAGRRTIPIHIDDKSKVQDIHAVVKTALKAPPRKRTASNTPSNSASVSTSANTSLSDEKDDVLIINLQLPECQSHIPNAEETQQVITATNLLVFNGEMTIDEFKTTVESLESKIEIRTVDKTVARTAFIWFMRELFNVTLLAGSVIGGKMTHLFEDPGKQFGTNTNFHSFSNKLLYQAKVYGILKSCTCKGEVKHIFGNMTLKYHKVAMYSLAEGHKVSKTVLDQLLDQGEADWCLPLSNLTRVTAPHSPRSAGSAGSNKSNAEGKKRARDPVSIPPEEDSDSD